MATSTSRDRGGYPPDSTRLRIGDDVAWADVGGVYDRDDSLKENTNPKCLLKAHNPAAPGQHHHHHNGAASQRFSGNLKSTAAPIIGLSGKLGQGGARRTHQQHPPAMFPKKAKTGGGGRNPRPAVPEDEPSSPKVSCIGKVLSERERARRRPRTPPSDSRERPPSGCCPGLGFLMRRSRSRKSAVESVDWSPPPPATGGEAEGVEGGRYGGGRAGAGARAWRGHAVRVGEAGGGLGGRDGGGRPRGEIRAVVARAGDLILLLGWVWFGLIASAACCCRALGLVNSCVFVCIYR